MNKIRRRGASPLAARVIGIALIAGAAMVTVGSFAPISFPWNRVLHVTVVSPDVGTLNPEASVEMNGVRVGSIAAIDYVDRQAHIRLAIQPSFANKVHADAGAIIQPHGLLGPKYVALVPGHRGRMRDGGVIPAQRTKVTTDFDQVLNSLQPDVRTSLQTIFVELGNASDGRGEDMNSAIKSLSTASGDLKTTSQVLVDRKLETTDFIQSSERLNADVQKASIAANIADTNKVLIALVAVEDSIGSTIDHSDAVLEQVLIALTDNSSNLGYVLGKAPTTVKNLNAYIDTADPLVNAVRPHVPNLLTAVVEGKSVTAGKDANGHYVRVLALSGACTAAPSTPITSCSAGAPGGGGPLPGLPQPSDGGSAPSAPSIPAAPGTGSTMTDAQLAALLIGT